MAIPFFGKKNSARPAGRMSTFAGFEQVRPVYGPAGTERFGVIESSPESSRSFVENLFSRNKKPVTIYTGALRLSGPALNLWLGQDKDTQQFYESLCRALPFDGPAQFLLRRRNKPLEQHYQTIQEKALRRIKDGEIASYFLQEYLDSQVYPAEESGLSEIWFGLLVSANSVGELTANMAALMATLPCDATPCTATELTRLVMDYYAPLQLESLGDNDQFLPGQLFPERLAQANPNIAPESFSNGLANAFWKIAAPPLSHPEGWLSPLLDNERLAFCDFDVALHLTPANRDDKLLEVLERRLAFLDEQLETAFTRQDMAVIDDLQEQREEVANRLSAALSPDNRYFEAGITLALRSEPLEFEATCQLFEDELRNCGLAARRTYTAAETRAAMLECAPLNLPQTDRPLVMPTVEAGRLAHLTPIAAPINRHTLIGLSRLSEPVYLNPANKAGDTAFFLLGEPGKHTAHQARTILRYMTAMEWLDGTPVCGLDRKGEWEDLAIQLGGQYVALGPNEPVYNFNPLDVTDDTLKWNDKLVSWLNETSTFLGGLLKLDSEMQEDLLAVLFEAAVARVNRGEELNAASLWIRAEGGGYGPLSLQLKELTLHGRFGWLCSRPTRLPVPGFNSDLLFIGLSHSLRNALPEEQQKFLFARLFSRFAAQLCAAPAEWPYLVVLDHAQELLADPVSARSLAWLEQRGPSIGARLWLATPSPTDWLNSYQGRNLFDRANCHLFFNQGQAQMSPVARRFGLSQNLVETVREAGAGAAVVRQLDEDGQPFFFSFEPLPGNYVEKFAMASGRLTTPVSEPYKKSTPEEVQLFAPEEIWDEMEAGESFDDTETVEVAAISRDETALAVVS